MDGLGVLWIATSFALTAAWQGEIAPAIVWLIMAGAGAVELHGTVLLREGHRRGLTWLVASQLLFIALALAFCAHQLTHYDPTALRQALTDEVKANLAQANYDQEKFLLMIWRTVYGAMAGATLLFKGGLALYFHRRRAAIAAATEVAEAN
jgi:hypothetical protein